MTADECVQEYTSTYTAKIREYIEDLKNKRGNLDIEQDLDPGMDAILDEGNEQVIDTNKYLDKFQKMAHLPAAAQDDFGPAKRKEKDSIFFDESPI